MKDHNNYSCTCRLTNDPELRHTAKGKACCNFRVAVNNSYRDSEGNDQKETLYLDVVTWEGLATLCGKSLEKGKWIFLSGKLKEDQWTDNDGNKRSKIKLDAKEMIFLTKPDSGFNPEED